jgi:hypothetical protein
MCMCTVYTIYGQAVSGMIAQSLSNHSIIIYGNITFYLCLFDLSPLCNEHNQGVKQDLPVFKYRICIK